MKSNKETILKMYFVDKLRPVDIAKNLGISKSAVSQCLKNDDRYTKEKEKRISDNKEKNKRETKDYIRTARKKKQFKRNLDDSGLKQLHNQASAELSKKKRMTNMAYRDWNKSAFTYNEKRKGFEFRNELGRSYDVPKFIEVEV